MHRYIVRRVAQSIPLLLVVSLLVFALIHAAPGGPLVTRSSKVPGPDPSPEVVGFAATTPQRTTTAPGPAASTTDDHNEPRTGKPNSAQARQRMQARDSRSTTAVKIARDAFHLDDAARW